MTITATPVDNIVRALAGGDLDGHRAATLDDDGTDGSGRTLHGYFAVFNRWTEIDSIFEGRFQERIFPGAFADVFASGRDVKVLYDHGHDPELGNKPLGTIRSLTEDKVGAHYEVDLIATRYNDEFVIPAAAAGLLGASFRFKVAEESWTEPKRSTKGNPNQLPERTILRVDPLYEFGPVTFPAYPDGTDAGIRSRSGTDTYVDRLLHDPLFLARFTERVGLPAVEHILAEMPYDEDASPPSERDEDPDVATAGPSQGVTPAVRPRMSLEDLRADRALLTARLKAALSERTGT